MFGMISPFIAVSFNIHEIGVILIYIEILKTAVVVTKAFYQHLRYLGVNRIYYKNHGSLI